MESLLLMHDDAAGDHGAWESYLAKLRRDGVFQGGRAICGGPCMHRAGATPPITTHLTG